MKIRVRAGTLLIGVAVMFAMALFTGCQTTGEGAEQEPPSFPAKSVNDSSFKFDSFERKRAIRAYNKIGADMLFCVVINRQGDVQKLNLVRSNQDGFTTHAFTAYVRGMKFTPASEDDPHPYRALFYPLALKTDLIQPYK